MQQNRSCVNADVIMVNTATNRVLAFGMTHEVMTSETSFGTSPGKK